MNDVAIVFPGQGSQYIGMGKTIYDEYQIAKQTFEEVDCYLGFELSKLCFEGSAIELNRVENMFPAIIAVSVALFRIYSKEIGIIPHFTAGHSLGEYSALVCSGAMEFRDALRIVQLRGRLACDTRYTESGTMTVVSGISKNSIEKQCKQISNKGSIVAVSCYNSVDQFVVSGNNDAVLELEDSVIELGAQITPMMMSPPIHSRLMLAASERLREELKTCSFRSFNWPVISNVNALPYEEGTDSIINNLANQLIMPVRWLDIMKYTEEHDIKTVIEMGNQAILTNLVKMKNPEFKAYSFGQKDDRTILLHRASHLEATGDKTGKTPAPGIISRCLAIAVSVPNSNWNNDEYKKGVEASYEKIESIQEKLDNEKIPPTNEEIQEAFGALKVILNTKGISSEEQQELYNELYSLM